MIFGNESEVKFRRAQKDVDDVVDFEVSGSEICKKGERMRVAGFQMVLAKFVVKMRRCRFYYFV